MAMNPNKIIKVYTTVDDIYDDYYTAYKKITRDLCTDNEIAEKILLPVSTQSPKSFKEQFLEELRTDAGFRNDVVSLMFNEIFDVIMQSVALDPSLRSRIKDLAVAAMASRLGHAAVLEAISTFKKEAEHYPHIREEFNDFFAPVHVPENSKGGRAIKV
jgi:hypothetical protein